MLSSHTMFQSSSPPTTHHPHHTSSILPTACKLVPLALLDTRHEYFPSALGSQAASADDESPLHANGGEIVSYRCCCSGATFTSAKSPQFSSSSNHTNSHQRPLILTLDSHCNIRIIDMHSQVMKVFAIGIRDVVSRQQNFHQDSSNFKFQRAIKKPFIDWQSYGNNKLLLLQKFDNKVYYLDLKDVMDQKDDMTESSFGADYGDEETSHRMLPTLIQIAQHDSPLRAISVQLEKTEVDPASISNDLIQWYLLITGADNGECRVWRFKDGDPPTEMQCLFEVQAHAYQITSVATCVYSFMEHDRKILAITAGSDRVLKVHDVLKQEWYTEKPIEQSLVRLMKTLTLRNGEQYLVTVNALGSVLLYSVRNNMSLYQSIYVNIGGGKTASHSYPTYQISDICNFVDPISKKDVIVVPCCDTSHNGDHLLKFFVDGALLQEYNLPHPVLFCTIFDNLQPNAQHLVVGNSMGLIDAWNLVDIMKTEELLEEEESHTEHDDQSTSLEEAFEREMERGSSRDESLVADSEEDNSSSISGLSHPEVCPSPTTMRPRNHLPEPMRDSRQQSLDDSISAQPRRLIPRMHTKTDQPVQSFAQKKDKYFVLPPNTPRERLDAPRPTESPQEAAYSSEEDEQSQVAGGFLMPSSSPQRKHGAAVSYPKQPKPSVIRHSPPKKSKQEYSKRVQWNNPKEFMNILEQQAQEIEHPEEFPDHPLAQPRAYTTRLLEKQIEELQNEEFDPEKYMKEKQLITNKDAGYEFDKKDALYTDLPSVSSPTPSEVSRTRKRKVPKQVSLAYLEEQRIQAPQFDELIFPSELQEEVKCSVDSQLFNGSQWWKASGKMRRRDGDLDDPLNAPLDHNTTHRFAKYFLQNPHWFHE